jgi:hypothetical protein
MRDAALRALSGLCLGSAFTLMFVVEEAAGRDRPGRRASRSKLSQPGLPRKTSCRPYSCRIRNAPAEPLLDRTWPCPEFECCCGKLLPRELFFDHRRI